MPLPWAITILVGPRVYCYGVLHARGVAFLWAGDFRSFLSLSLFFPHDSCRNGGAELRAIELWHFSFMYNRSYVAKHPGEWSVM